MPTKSGLRILAVDDEPAILELLRDCLKLVGHDVTTCSDATEGVARFENEQFDVVLTDRVMPGMTGEEFAAEIKRISPDTCVIMVSGRVGGARKSADSPIDALLLKPFTLAELYAAVDGACLHTAQSPAA